MNTSKSKSFQTHDLNAPKFKNAQSFVPRSVMRKGKGNVSGYDSSELEPEIEARFHALKTKTVRHNHTQPDFTKMHYQQLTTIDRYGKPKTVMAWVDNSN